MPAGGLPALETQVNLLAGKLTALEASLASHKTRLESALTELAAASANGASVPQLIDLTTTLATEVNALMDALKAWSDGEVSQTYIDNLLP